jgi:hypothetical protein
MPIELIAHEIIPNDSVIEPSGPRREWMDKSCYKAAYRRLPLTMANQVGWVIRSATRRPRARR